MKIGHKENVIWHQYEINRKKREKLHNHKSGVLWFTGLSGSGKSTIADKLEKVLYKKNISTYLLDGDNIRHGLCRDLNFTENDRRENIRRTGELVKLMVDAGLLVITAFVSPYRKDRANVRNIIDCKNFFEIFLDTPIHICEKRDPKGLYKKSRLNLLDNFTGITSRYEIPYEPDIYLNGEDSFFKNINNILYVLKKKKVF
ncbi:adenylyl-sulfate kinase [Buchnera aphidicola (Pemphigus obesinymphae)]|uniref:adenylyl-sulfate kinase n=1 Tax=Buchnera aphidicola TaxID=9 RepID=UPI0022370F3A|nr:adenylyl-sulfate kinase [Buchnera aphidicola]MCW5196713.1 adenylyl-sulfate kinase [Buchnera aphidicola (Pemphigus obesinymphae)]